MKEFRGSIAISYPYDGVEEPLKIAAAVEAAFKKGVEELKKIAPGAKITLSTGIVTARAKKPAGVEPADPNQTELSDAVAAAGGNPGGPGKGAPVDAEGNRDIGEDQPGDVPAFMRGAA